MGSGSKRCLLYGADGAGVDLARFYPRGLWEKEMLRRELGYEKDAFILANVAEINRNKNQIMLVRALPELKKHISNLKVLFIGRDNYPAVREATENMLLGSTVEFLGYRNDVDKLTAISDIAFSASLREGLPANIIEAMACGTPVVCSKNRGHCQLIEHGVSGLLFSVNSMNEMIRQIMAVYGSRFFAGQLCGNAIEKSKRYGMDAVMAKMAGIYRQYMAKCEKS